MPYMEHLRDLNHQIRYISTSRTPSCHLPTAQATTPTRENGRTSTVLYAASDAGHMAVWQGWWIVNPLIIIKPIFLAGVARIRMMSVRVIPKIPKKITVQNKSNCQCPSISPLKHVFFVPKKRGIIARFIFLLTSDGNLSKLCRFLRYTHFILRNLCGILHCKCKSQPKTSNITPLKTKILGFGWFFPPAFGRFLNISSSWWISFRCFGLQTSMIWEYLPKDHRTPPRGPGGTSVALGRRVWVLPNSYVVRGQDT